jgi:archaeal preflagellin peptidase FlaK
LIAANLVVSIVILLYSSWSDYKTREVSNKVWAVYGPIALILTLSELLLFEQSQLPFYGLGVGLSVGLAFLLFYVGGFGGADSKALMCIALALPFAPLALFKPIFSFAISPTSEIMFPITIFGNAVLFAAFSGVYMVLRNIVWHMKNKAKFFPGTMANQGIGKKILVVVTGYKMNISKVKEKWHLFPMEDVDDCNETLNRKLVVVPKDEGRIEIVQRLSDAVEAGKIERYVWTTPGLPMLIFVTLGLIAALTLGDFVWLIVRAVMGL